MTMRRSLFALALFTLSLSVAASSSLAQDDEAAAEEAPAGPPTTTGRSEAQAAVGQAGMTFELRNGARAFVPPNLPIGDSRRIRFAEARGRLVPGHVADGFRRVGPILSFDGAINATSSPVLISIRQPRDPARAGQRVVLAMEQATICREGLDPLPDVTNLCSGWELVPATWSDGRLEARLTAPGGYRLLFGTVPDAAPPAE
ncbi:MAG: hypothetical protein M3Y87_34645 [Myxococcota bacterium]|nr:hypothetical protein [Myxococcota bacterium]